MPTPSSVDTEMKSILPFPSCRLWEGHGSNPDRLYRAHSKDFVIVRESEAFVLQISSKTMTRDSVTKCELVTPDTKAYQFQRLYGLNAGYV
ncbi:unnamed protein product [Timema podura]|uniref:Uncharacterized protein n=1 Tax=Timema podura TaxID=61482 RepID=A0ABN7PFS9_TIMPD|nr:unnamed protein product [Timema podura]